MYTYTPSHSDRRQIKKQSATRDSGFVSREGRWAEDERDALKVSLNCFPVTQQTERVGAGGEYSGGQRFPNGAGALIKDLRLIV